MRVDYKWQWQCRAINTIKLEPISTATLSAACDDDFEYHIYPFSMQHCHHCRVLAFYLQVCKLQQFINIMKDLHVFPNNWVCKFCPFIVRASYYSRARINFYDNVILCFHASNSFKKHCLFAGGKNQWKFEVGATGWSSHSVLTSMFLEVRNTMMVQAK